MGDRANIHITSARFGSDVWLYTHWDGYRLEQLAADGLRKAVEGGRVADSAYLGRIVAQHFFNAHGDQVTGAGLTSSVTDGGQHVVHIDVDAQTVDYDPTGYEYGVPEHKRKVVPIAEFLAAYPPEPVKP
jgi:hypothetical protein